MDFNKEAANWDTPQRLERAAVIAGEIRRSVSLQGELKALEFGAGTGLISFELADSLAEIWCVDPSAAMIAKLQEKIAQRKQGNIRACCAAIESIEAPGEGFDLIYTSMALHHASDLLKTLTTLARLLRFGGSLCIVDLDEDDGSFHRQEENFSGYHGFQQTGLKAVLEKVGFSEVKAKTFYHGKKKLENGTEHPYSLFSMSGKKSS
ncbi:class I SAM-dependent methyltransferase [Azotosporobacter soli]|uniref:class I SAM-dependent methyltransferase n=1 Tax=Azotosporobacter soli TaxID=3055040 RepID=UPI0031FF1373